jgi:DNA-binding CsgD family transcriptional regulator
MITDASRSSGKAMSQGGQAKKQPEELVRLLVSQVVDGPPNQASARDQDSAREEVLLDIDIDGARYLLVRLPLANAARAPLSPREQEIVRMVAQGHSNKIIADVLGISSWTVCTHLRRIFAKLGVGSRAAMVARLLEGRGQAKTSVACKAVDP